MFEARTALLLEIVVLRTVLGWEEVLRLSIPPPMLWLSWWPPVPATAELPVIVEFWIWNVAGSAFAIAPPMPRPATLPERPLARLPFRVERWIVSVPLPALWIAPPIPGPPSSRAAPPMAEFCA